MSERRLTDLVALRQRLEGLVNKGVTSALQLAGNDMDRAKIGLQQKMLHLWVEAEVLAAEARNNGLPATLTGEVAGILAGTILGSCVRHNFGDLECQLRTQMQFQAVFEGQLTGRTPRHMVGAQAE